MPFKRITNLYWGQVSDDLDKVIKSYNIASFTVNRVVAHGCSELLCLVYFIWDQASCG